MRKATANPGSVCASHGDQQNQQWTTDVAGAGETVKIHARDVAVDAIYA